jgi:alkylation response protein AidB-like acyl-CoA dehydrogenase
MPKIAGIEISEDHALMRDAIVQFARGRVAEGAAKRDLDQGFPEDLVAEMAELGLLTMKCEESQGGAGMDNVGYVLAMEAIAEACASTCVILASCNLSSKIMSEFCNDEQVERYLKPAALGEFGAISFALSEPASGSDAKAMRTVAKKDGDDYLLTGQKMWITNGSHAGLHLVFARTSGEVGSKGGISAFLVEKGAPGLEVGREEHKMGLRASGTVPLMLDGCRVPARNMVGEEGAGYRIALSGLGAGRVGIAAQCIGIATAALNEGIAYASEREAFGATVSSFQNSQFAIADSAMEIDQAWLLAMRAARLLDEKQKAAKESSMAKLWASEACGRVVDRMLQLHGGYGYVNDYPIERLYRDARVTRIYEGSSEVQRIVIAREVLRAA